MRITESPSVAQRLQALEAFYGCDQSARQAFSAWLPVGFLLRTMTLMYCGEHHDNGNDDGTPAIEQAGGKH